MHENFLFGDIAMENIQNFSRCRNSLLTEPGMIAGRHLPICGMIESIDHFLFDTDRKSL